MSGFVICGARVHDDKAILQKKIYPEDLTIVSVCVSEMKGQHQDDKALPLALYVTEQISSLLSTLSKVRTRYRSVLSVVR